MTFLTLTRSIVNEAAAASPVQPIVNMGQGFLCVSENMRGANNNTDYLCSGYNPPKFALDAAKDALDRVECNQYSPTKVRVGNMRGRVSLIRRSRVVLV